MKVAALQNTSATTFLMLEKYKAVGMYFYRAIELSGSRRAELVALGDLNPAKEVIFLFSSRLLTGDQDLGFMGGGPCGWVSSFSFLAPFWMLVGSLSIPAPVCSLPIQFPRQQMLRKGLWGSEPCRLSHVWCSSLQCESFWVIQEFWLLKSSFKFNA